MGGAGARDASLPHSLRSRRLGAWTIWLLVRSEIRTEARNVVDRPAGKKSRGRSDFPGSSHRVAALVEKYAAARRQIRAPQSRRRRDFPLSRFHHAGTALHGTLWA